MNAKESIDLKRLIRQQGDDYQDNTDGIRRLRHSTLIHEDILALEKMKQEHGPQRDKAFQHQCQKKCAFLYNSYTDIFNRVYNDELDLELMAKALHTLKQIEDGSINQQEGSVLMGKLFYQVFVDSALKKGEKLEKERQEEEQEEDASTAYRNDEKPISYKDFKKQKAD